MKKIKKSVIFCLLTLSIFQNAFADTATNNLQLNALLSPVCYIVVGNSGYMSFGDMTQYLLSGNFYTSNQLTVTCTKTTPYTISLDQGASGSYSQRNMVATKTGNNDKVYYNVYTDSTFSKVLGDGSSSSYTITDTGTGVKTYRFIYAKLVGQPYVTPDNYKDNLILTLTY